ncbi:peroxiredoxin [Gymnodinialimonas sp.]
MSLLAKRLTGAAWPSLSLPATDGSAVDLSRAQGTSVVYIYPRTSPPDGTSLPGWAEIPGAKGCTPQSCGFRDHFSELQAAGAAAVFGLSVQDTAYQAEAASRLHLPFPLLSDADGALQTALNLPTFEAAGMVLLTRMALVITNGRIEAVFHPVTDPAANAEEILRYLRSRKT